LRYIATINGVQIESATQTLKVEIIRAADLPRPLLNGVANDGVLDLNTFAGDALAAVAKWRLSATGQRVWLTCSSPYVADLVVLDGVAITAVEAVKGLANIAVLRSWLQRVKFRQITVTCKVTFDGSREEQTAIPFLKSTYEIEWQKGIIDSINVGSQPHYIVITRDGSTAYVTNHGSHSVSVIDVPKRKVIRTIGGFNNPFRIVLHPDESRLYVGNLGAKTISVVDTRNDAIIQTIPGFNYIWGLAINASGTLLFANCSVDSRVFVHDAKTGARLASTYVQNAYGLALNPLQTLLYCGGPTKLSILNAAAVEGVIKEVGGFSPATNMAFNLRDLPYSRVYVTGLHAVVIVNTDTNVVHKTLGGFYSAYAVAMNPRVHECYVSSGGSLVTVINTHTESVVRTHTGFANPADVAVEPTGKVVLVANQANGTVSFVAV
jgi:YVTN family beta-propeller protein